MKYSVITPIFNRPLEIEELFASLTKQTFKEFEIIIVEDGSHKDCSEVVESFQDKLTIKYFMNEKSGPAKSRNFGASKASGQYLVFFDSDCLIPENYFEIVNDYLSKEDVDVWGGPDAAHSSFTTLQKAINHSMTSLFTTGKIRGGEKIDKFHPRSFNLGIKKEVFDKLGGFPITTMWPGEDMVFSIELIKRGYKSRLFQKAKVYHKRRNTLKSFFIQVFRFGKVRYIISRIYPETFKIFFLFPSLFLLGNIVLLFLSLFNPVFLFPVILYILLVFSEAILNNNSFQVSLYSIFTAFIQLSAYGLGFIYSLINSSELNKYKNGFYNN